MKKLIFIHFLSSYSKGQHFTHNSNFEEKFSGRKKNKSEEKCLKECWFIWTLEVLIMKNVPVHSRKSGTCWLHLWIKDVMRPACGRGFRWSSWTYLSGPDCSLRKIRFKGDHPTAGSQDSRYIRIPLDACQTLAAGPAPTNSNSGRVAWGLGICISQQLWL